MKKWNGNIYEMISGAFVFRNEFKYSIIISKNKTEQDFNKIKSKNNHRWVCFPHNFTIDARKYSSGIYYYKIEAGDFAEVKKMSLI